MFLRVPSTKRPSPNEAGLSPPISPMKQFGPRPLPDDVLSQSELLLTPTSSPKRFGSQKEKNHSPQPTQEELLRIAMERKRTSTRIQRAFERRTTLAAKQGNTRDPSEEFAIVFDDVGDFVLGCIE